MLPQRLCFRTARELFQRFATLKGSGLEQDPSIPHPVALVYAEPDGGDAIRPDGLIRKTSVFPIGPQPGPFLDCDRLSGAIEVHGAPFRGSGYDPIVEENTRDLKRRVRESRRHLRNLTRCVSAYLHEVDLLMQERDSVARGRKLSKLTNLLEFANDSARHFGLGEKLKPK